MSKMNGQEALHDAGVNQLVVEARKIEAKITQLAQDEWNHAQQGTTPYEVMVAVARRHVPEYWRWNVVIAYGGAPRFFITEYWGD